MIFINFFLILAGIFMFLFAYSAVEYVIRIRKKGAHTTGTFIEMHDSILGERPVYSFEDAEGKQIEGFAENIKRGRRSMFYSSPGTKVDIYYWPHEPEVFIVNPGFAHVVHYIFMLFGIMLFLAGILSLIFD